MAIEFTDAADNYCNVARTDFELQPPVCISAWVYMKSNVAGNGIWSMGQNSGLLCYQVGGSPGKVRMYVREKTPIQWQYNESTNNINNNEWHHFLHVVFNFLEGVDTASFYLDGVIQESLNPGAYGGDINYVARENFAIGSYYSTFAYHSADVIIEDFAIWNSDMDMGYGLDNKIQLLARSHRKRMPLQIEPENLMLYLPFDEANPGTDYERGIVGASAFDWSGSGHNGTIVGVTNPTGAEGILTYPGDIL